MKRRKFIQAAVLTGASPLVATAGASAGRLYGEPGSIVPGGGSVSDKFLLPLSRTGVPHESWLDLSRISQVVENVLVSNEEASRFFADPAGYLQRMGLDGSDRTLVEESTRFLVGMSHSRVREALASRDYDAFFQYMEAAGVFEPRNASALEERIHAVLQEHSGRIREALQDMPAAHLDGDHKQEMLKALRDSGVTVTESDLAILSEILASGDGHYIASCTAIAMCAVGVGIAAIAALYVSVVVAATVILAVGAGVSAAVVTAVTVTGIMPYRNEKAQESLVSSPFDGTFARLDPKLMRNSDRAIKMARLTKDGALQIEVSKRLIAEEVSAVLRAMHRSDLLPLEEPQLEVAISATTLYAQRALGLSH